jgi:predicted nucleic acid-binding protein
MKRYLLDTNHLSAAIRVISPVREDLRQAYRKGHRFYTCWPVLCELEDGIVQTADPDDYRRTLKTIMSEIRIYSSDWNIVRAFGEVAQSLRKRGRDLSLVDMTLAAFAIEKRATVLTTDLDFRALREVRTENWLALPKS